MLPNLYFSKLVSFQPLEENSTDNSMNYLLNIPSGIIGDLSSFLLGVRLRQLRMKNGSCRVPDLVKDLYPDCISSYNMYTDDNDDYMEGWKKPGEQSINATTGSENDDAQFSDGDPFKYKSSIELAGEPSTFSLATYSGGGYVADLGRNGENARKMLEYLEERNWLDLRTRVLFVEFLAYNPNTQLYTSATIAIEFLAGSSGNSLASMKISSLKLNKYGGANGLILILLQFLTLCFVVYFMYGEVKQFFYLRWTYFQVHSFRKHT